MTTTRSLSFAATLLTLALLAGSALTGPARAADSSGSAAEDLLSRSIAHHDPEGRWADGAFHLTVQESRPDGRKSSNELWFDNARSHFQSLKESEEAQVRQVVDGEDCRFEVDGSSQLTAEQIETHRLDCDRAQRFRDYYLYVWGLPMKLRDPGTILHPEVRQDRFQDLEVDVLKVTYEAEVGGDIWYFYFDPATAALVGYRFYHDESANDGEYIVLTDEVEGAGLRLPKKREWYVNKDGRFLGTDDLQSIKDPSR